MNSYDGTTTWPNGRASCGGIFEAAHSPKELTEIEERIAAPDFWKDQAGAQKVMQRRRQIEEENNVRESLRRRSDDLTVLVEWANAREDVGADLARSLDELADEVEAA